MALNKNMQCPEKPLNSYLLHCWYLREQYPDVRYSSVQLSKLWKEADPNLKKMFKDQAGELGKIYTKAMETYRSVQLIESLLAGKNDQTSSSERYQIHLKLLKSYKDLAVLNADLNHKPDFLRGGTSPTSLSVNEPFYLDISSTEKQLDLIRFEDVNQSDILIPKTYPN
ncbi:hypothetical protein HDV02_002236 [Globomyces sp. JEL0801]|nr:hypothetical protein HDV02_002236 [Globomyces sp. JEL0801]